MKKINAKFYGIPCYYEAQNNVLEGRNWFYDKLIIGATIFHQFCNFLFDLDYPFRIELDVSNLTDEEREQLDKYK
jgi:hypothetical protein